MLLGCWSSVDRCRENLGIHSKVSAENRRFILKVLQKHFVFGNLDDVPCHDLIQVMLSPITLPETNIAPENRPLEKEIPIGNHHF